jgi:hypothetical protein
VKKKRGGLEEKSSEKTVEDEPLERAREQLKKQQSYHIHLKVLLSNAKPRTKFPRETYNVFQLTFDKHNFT